MKLDCNWYKYFYNRTPLLKTKDSKKCENSRVSDDNLIEFKCLCENNERVYGVISQNGNRL